MGRNLFLKYRELAVGRGLSPIPTIGKVCPIKGWNVACHRPLINDEIGPRFLDPEADVGIAVATGFNDLVAFDFDGGTLAQVNALRDIFAAHSRLVAPCRGSKGATVFCRITGMKIRRFAGVLDVLGSGGSKVLPPTIHPNTGRPYAWLGEVSLFDLHVCHLPVLPIEVVTEIAEALSPWIPLAAPPRPRTPIAYADRNVRWVVERRVADLRAAGVGGRNFELYCAARRLARLGLRDDEIVSHLLPVTIEIGLPRREALRTIGSGINSSNIIRGAA